MDKLYFSEEHLMLRDMVRDFAVNEVRPISKDIDKKSIFPKENIKKMAELGLMGIPWDTKVFWNWNGYSRISHCN